MHARVSIRQIQPGKMEEAIRIVKESGGPAARQRPGYGGGITLADRSTGKVLNITLWQTEEDMMAHETAADRQQMTERYSEITIGPNLTEHYEAYSSTLFQA